MELEGYKIFRELHMIKTEFYITHENYKQLVKEINNFERDIKAFDGRRSANYGFRIKRFFHNYCLSARALVGYTYRYRKHFGNSNFDDGCNKRIDKMMENIDVQLLQEIWDFIMHREGANTVVRQLSSWSSSGEKSYQKDVWIKRSQLLNDEKINPVVKEHLKNSNDDINIKKLVTTYHSEIISFNKWFFEESLKTNKTAIRELGNFERKHFPKSSLNTELRKLRSFPEINKEKNTIQ